MIPRKAKLGWEARALLPGTSAHGQPALEQLVKAGKGWFSCKGI